MSDHTSDHTSVLNTPLHELDPDIAAAVDAAHSAPGTTGVGVDIRGSHEPYEVVALPFYKREK